MTFGIKVLCTFLLAITATITCKAIAHPHSWIALSSEFILDERGNLVEIRQRWDFDIFYSMMTMADMMNEYRDQEVGLKKLADQMIRNLESYGYFSRLHLDSDEMPLSKPNHYVLQTKTEEGEQVLSLEMRFKIAPPSSVEGKVINWSVYDPTYYIHMAHNELNAIRVNGGNATECSKAIDFPEPSDEIIEYAASLDRTQRDTQGLGDYFAEQVTIQCF